MGIKNIHIALIVASFLIATIFAVWSLTHAYQVLGVVSLGVAAGLMAYGIYFVKKARAL